MTGAMATAVATGSDNEPRATESVYEFRVSEPGDSPGLKSIPIVYRSERLFTPAMRQWFRAAHPIPLSAYADLDEFEVEFDRDVLEAFNRFMLNLMDTLPPPRRGRVAKAFVLAHILHDGVKRKTGEPYILHPLAVADRLRTLDMDVDCLSAALLHDVVEDAGFSLEEIKRCFSPAVAEMVNGVTKLQRINVLSSSMQDQDREPSRRKAETLRKMFVAMVDDIRVVIIKLADRIHNMQTLDGQTPLKRKTIALETLEIYAPLANRLGIGQFKWELEDLSFRHLDREAYDEISQAMAQTRVVRERWAKSTRDLIQGELDNVGIKAEVTGRPKHIYSIYKKMERKGIPFSEVYDIQGFRVVTSKVSDCYAALGLIHGLWRPIPGEFDDYIANPKENMYQSLHTAVIGPGGNSMEVQIRTREMHTVAELGVASHWQYKEQVRAGGPPNKELTHKVALLRALMEWNQDWNQDEADAEEYVNRIQSDIFKDRVYVFTPVGEVIDLPAGSTPIDFAYHIHTELGERCRGAKVNGMIVQLNYQLQNGDQVIIISAKRGGPSRDWLNAEAGYVRSQRARQKIMSYFRKQARESSISHGRLVVDRELKRYSVKYGFDEIAGMFNYDSLDDFLAAVGYADITVPSLVKKILDRERQEKEEEELNSLIASERRRASGNQNITGVMIQGEGGLLAQPAGCCKPLPGDDVLGYITKGKGITVHKSECSNLAARREVPGEAARIVPIQWNEERSDSFYNVRIEVKAYDRAGLLRDVTGVVADAKINMLHADATVDSRDSIATIHVEMEIRDIPQLSRVVSQIERLPNVRQVFRKVG